MDNALRTLVIARYLLRFTRCMLRFALYVAGYVFCALRVACCALRVALYASRVTFYAARCVACRLFVRFCTLLVAHSLCVAGGSSRCRCSLSLCGRVYCFVVVYVAVRRSLCIVVV